MDPTTKVLIAALVYYEGVLDQIDEFCQEALLCHFLASKLGEIDPLSLECASAAVVYAACEAYSSRLMETQSTPSDVLLLLKFQTRLDQRHRHAGARTACYLVHQQ